MSRALLPPPRRSDAPQTLCPVAGTGTYRPGEADRGERGSYRRADGTSRLSRFSIDPPDSPTLSAFPKTVTSESDADLATTPGSVDR